MTSTTAALSTQPQSPLIVTPNAKENENKDSASKSFGAMLESSKNQALNTQNNAQNPTPPQAQLPTPAVAVKENTENKNAESKNEKAPELAKASENQNIPQEKLAESKATENAQKTPDAKHDDAQKLDSQTKSEESKNEAPKDSNEKKASDDKASAKKDEQKVQNNAQNLAHAQNAQHANNVKNEPKDTKKDANKDDKIKATNATVATKAQLDLKDKKVDSKDIKDTKTLNDIKKVADEKNLNLNKIVLEKNAKDSKDAQIKDATHQNAQMLKDKLNAKASNTNTAINEKAKHLSMENSQKEKLLIALLNKYDPQKNAKRLQENKADKIDYKIGNGDKSMIIDREINLPKNIVDSKIRNKQMHDEFVAELNEIMHNDKLDKKDEKSTKVQDKKVDDKASIALGDLIKKDVKDTKNANNSKDKNDNSALLKDIALAKEMTLKPDLDPNANKEKIASASASKDSKEVQNDGAKKEGTKEVAQKNEIAQNQLHSKQEVNYRNAIARESIKNFASAFKEGLENYKPPITKINVELNPANLGEVTLSISKKGNDLSVNITSNNNVMNLFAQNASDLRNNLMNLGFNNLDLNFHSKDGHGNKEPQDEKAPNKAQNVDKIKEVEDNAIAGIVPSEINVLIPNYA